MIVSASYRTDIPAYYGQWLMRRLEAGYALVASPYGGPDYRVSLRAGEAQALQLWSRNMGPLLAQLDAVRAHLPFAVTFTLTGYPRALEKATLPAERALDQMRQIARRFGPRALVWRYDPVVVSDLTPPDWHRAQVAKLARALRGATDEATFSFLQPYAKSARHLDAAAKAHGFTWRDPPDEEKKALLADLAAIARQEGMTATLCAQPHLLSPGLAPAQCIDARRLSDVAGIDIAAKQKGNRPGCACALSRDIGAYDSCAQGCAYCYAVRAPALAQTNLAAHDPLAEKLVATPARRTA
ncbi:MAG: DUF1848 domain-containing protein [Reyranellaceae bacterium]